MNLNNEVIRLLNKNGCSICGFADIRCLPDEARGNYEYGILIALSFSKEAMIENSNGFPKRYSDEHDPMTQKLSSLKYLVADFLINNGYDVCINTPATIANRNILTSPLPLKTLGTLSGIGWIGKNAMLITNEVGSALRITGLLTNAHVGCGTPITISKCPAECSICADACPGNAPLGGLWRAGIERESFFDAYACQAAARARAKDLLDIDNESRCGLCISNCPFTKRALAYE